MSRRPLGFLLHLLLAATCPVVHADGDRIILYPGYGDATSVSIEGRIVENRAKADADISDGRIRNLWRNGRQFFNDERKNIAIKLQMGDHAGTVRSDQEGYFRLEEKISLAPGWHEVHAEGASASAVGRLLVVPQVNSVGLISDLDDTILVSEVTQKQRLLANTFLKNPSQREAVHGVADLYGRALSLNHQPAASPLFYLSASPRQMHDAIADFLDRNNFPPGVLITKRVTNDRTSDPLLDQFTYKIRKIEEIFARLPWVRFILVGDDGEKDPEIYDWVRQHHPEQVAAIWIRRVSPDPNRQRPNKQRNLEDVIAATPAAIEAEMAARPEHGESKENTP